MSFRQRVASVAALSLALVGLAAHSTAGFAAETPYANVPTPAPAIIVFQDGQAPQALPTPTYPAPVATTPPTETAAVDDDDTVAYPTLAAAVAAQPIEASDEQLRCLAGAIYFESKGEPLAGQLAVAEVILNRVAARRFGETVCDVVTQRGQFSFVRGGRIPSIPTGRASYRTAVAVAKVAMNDAWDSPAGKALFFHARRVSPGWNKTQVASIGNHVFYR